MKLVDVNEMRAIEREADASGWSYADMMERAGLGLAEIVHAMYGYEEQATALGLVGTGNNGGDTLVALARLAETGWKVMAYLVRARDPEDALVQQLLAAGGKVLVATQDPDHAQLDRWLGEATVLLDGVLGTGARLPLQDDLARLLRHVRETGFCPPVVAVDCPSGVDCDSGEAADEALKAELTVCMAALKSGLLRFPAHSLCGDFQVVDIGLPEGLAAWDAVQNEVVLEDNVREWLPQRPQDGHKGTFGTVMVMGGSLNYSGAVLLAAGGAARMGAGLVQVAIPSVLHPALAGHDPNLTWVLLPHQMGAIHADAAAVVLKSLDRATAMLVGPGFGLEDTSLECIRRLLESRPMRRTKGGLGFVAAASVTHGEEGSGSTQLPPLVFDADGLKLLAKIADWPKRLPPSSILTPHPGEMSILTGLSVADVQKDRFEVARRYAGEWGHVVVLKGAFTVIAAPDGRVRVIPIATNALAHGGTGDVLAGMITGLQAQKVAPFDAAAAAAWLHAQAGLSAAERVGHPAAIQASDLLDSIADVLSWVW